MSLEIHAQSIQLLVLMRTQMAPRWIVQTGPGPMFYDAVEVDPVAEETLLDRRLFDKPLPHQRVRMCCKEKCY